MAVWYVLPWWLYQKQQHLNFYKENACCSVYGLEISVIAQILAAKVITVSWLRLLIVREASKLLNFIFWVMINTHSRQR